MPSRTIRSFQLNTLAGSSIMEIESRFSSFGVIRDVKIFQDWRQRHLVNAQRRLNESSKLIPLVWQLNEFPLLLGKAKSPDLCSSTPAKEEQDQLVHFGIDEKLPKLRSENVKPRLNESSKEPDLKLLPLVWQLNDFPPLLGKAKSPDRRSSTPAMEKQEGPDIENNRKFVIDEQDQQVETCKIKSPDLCSSTPTRVPYCSTETVLERIQ
jgi:hypothetical protein